ncbi:hypothetical protein ACTFIW_011502 [Dictyostelium discoideum]
MKNIKIIIILIISLIFLISISNSEIFGRSEQCPLISLLKIGEDCQSSSDCEYPNICKNNKCQEIVQVGDACESDEECGLFFNNIGKCISGTCDVNLKNGDDCGEGHSGTCGEGSVCKFYKCVLNKGNCTSDSQCPFNHYCEENSNTCTPVVLGNQCNRDSMCPITHICQKNECVAKYSRETATPCGGNPELCDVFNGDECDKVHKICKRNDKYGSECYVDGDCGTGVCICNNDGHKQCVGSNTTLVHDGCLQAINSFVKCMKDKRCSSVSPLTCKDCYPIWECYRYNCFASEHFDQRKSAYYKSLKCDTEVGSLVNPDAANPNYNGGSNRKTNQKRSNSNSNYLISLSLTLTLVLILLILF